MSITYNAARDAINLQFYTDWQALAPAQNNSVEPPVRWMGDDSGNNPDPAQPWAWITILHGPSFQDTLGPDAAGGRSFQRTGTVTIQIFAPLSRGQGLTQAEALAIIARNAFEGRTAGSGEIWFRNVAIQEVGADGAWFQVNVVADFLYDELK